MERERRAGTAPAAGSRRRKTGGQRPGGVLAALALAAALLPAAVPAGDAPVLKMATTTSTQASGLLEVLLPAFEQDTGIRVRAVAKGTGAAIRDGMDGNVDVILVHAPGREARFVAEGWGTRRYAVMHNDFVILGPPSDPAGVRGIKSAALALARIAAAGRPFVSRGDDSGTHTKEQALWEAAGVELAIETRRLVKAGRVREVRFRRPRGPWYLSVGQGMGKTLTIADERRAYTLADRGTFLKYKLGRRPALALEVLCEGDPRLSNPYGLIPVNPARHPHVNYPAARRLAEWLVSPRGQALIEGYRVLGHRLFYPDATARHSQ